MRTFFLAAVFVSSFVCFEQPAKAQELILPAGTLINCTLDEPSFSTASAEVGDPVICHARGVQQFGRAVFPRGAYLAGHLADAKDPGHFWGKGWMKLEFDRISLPDSELPVPGKLVAVQRYRVDREGKILGHGHPKRDAIEWLIPPLWPWKVVSLPARGPRPTLKGETQVTLRLMDDVTVPLASTTSRAASARPTASQPTLGESRAESSVRPVSNSRYITVLPPSIPALQSEASDTTPTTLAAPESVTTKHSLSQVTLIALKGETIYAAVDYWLEAGRLSYVLQNGDQGAFDLKDVDWGRTAQLNAERGITVTLRPGPRLR